MPKLETLSIYIEGIGLVPTGFTAAELKKRRQSLRPLAGN
jgi:hypothetical protein